MLNKKANFFVNQCAIGNEQRITTIAVTNLSNIGWNTIVPGLMSNETIKENVSVSICRLDIYIREKSLKSISLIKIDTEGFEFPVLKGLSEYFNNNRDRPPILCEIAPDTYPLLGCKIKQLFEYIIYYGYNAFNVVGFKKKIELTTLKNTTNVLFMSS
jgi:FkbM family methyltransferase